MKMERCPCCRQIIREMRMGVGLPPKKIKFFDLVMTFPGIGSAELQQRMGWKLQSTAAVYAQQLNEYLIPTGWKVKGSKNWGYRFERIVNREVDNGRGYVGRVQHGKTERMEAKTAGLDARAGARQVLDSA